MFSVEVVGVAEFLDGFDVERAAVLRAVGRLEEVWGRFQERRPLEVEGEQVADSLIATELALVRKELEANKFTIGIFGLIKRGKSTLLNSLIGREVSSMHVTPETAVPVYVDYGETPSAEVFFADGRIRHVAVEEVGDYTSQKTNPGNSLGVTYVHQRVPVGFLRHGTRLIDTPGLDDADADDVYTERTLQELDTVDAGVVVFLSPPTVGATEMKFLEQVVSRRLKKIFLVCNMYPQHFQDPDTRRSVLDYVGGRIVEASRRSGSDGEIRVYPVCALEAWEARKTDDIARFKASGVARLLRDLETYLAEVAGAQVLQDAADKVVAAANLAKGEVAVRVRLLEDPDQLAAHRSRVDVNVRELEREFDAAVAGTLAQVEPLRMRSRGLLLQPFARARTQLGKCETVRDLEQFVARFKREIEVSGELTGREFHKGFERLLAGLRVRLEDQFHGVMNELVPSLPPVALSPRGMLMHPDQMRDTKRKEASAWQGALGGAAAGSVVMGGLTFAAMAMLGPLGLVGGALVGWKLGDAFGGGRSVQRARDMMNERLTEISRELIVDFDGQVDQHVRAVRELVARRRHAFAGDLYQQFNLVEGLAKDPRLLESYMRDAERFSTAFDNCAREASNAAVPRGASLAVA